MDRRTSAGFRLSMGVLGALLLLLGVCQSHAQWAQTNGWGGAGAGIGKRASYPNSVTQDQCRVDPYVALLMSRLAKIEAERLRLCETFYSRQDNS